MWSSGVSMMSAVLVSSWSKELRSKQKYNYYNHIVMIINKYTALIEYTLFCLHECLLELTFFLYTSQVKILKKKMFFFLNLLMFKGSI